MNMKSIFVVASVAFALGLGVRPARAQKMYWAGSDGILRANIDGSDIEVLVEAVSSGPGDIELDLEAGKMYWTDRDTHGIHRADLDGTGVEDLVSGVDAYGIALDVSGGKMYWTMPGSAKILRANLDGSGVEDLVTTELWGALGIAVHAAGGKMYWAETDRIKRADLDGSNVEELFVSTSDASPYSLALDADAGKMYWTSAGIDFGLFPKIQRANLDGSGAEHLVDVEIGPLLGIALDLRGGKMYWTLMAGKIERANLDGSGVETILYTAQARGIALDLTVPPIPTVSEWGVTAMAALFLGAGAIITRQRARARNHRPDSRPLGGEPL